MNLNVVIMIHVTFIFENLLKKFAALFYVIKNLISDTIELLGYLA